MTVAHRESILTWRRGDTGGFSVLSGLRCRMLVWLEIVSTLIFIFPICHILFLSPLNDSS